MDSYESESQQSHWKTTFCFTMSCSISLHVAPLFVSRLILGVSHTVYGTLFLSNRHIYTLSEVTEHYPRCVYFPNIICDNDVRTRFVYLEGDATQFSIDENLLVPNKLVSGKPTVFSCEAYGNYENVSRRRYTVAVVGQLVTIILFFQTCKLMGWFDSSWLGVSMCD